MSSAEPYGLLAEFETAAELYHACEEVRDAGFSRWDAHTPFPVHGLNKAMGVPPSRLPHFVFVMGLTGACGAMLLQWWTSAVDYRIIIAAKPYFSWQAFVPITFEVMVLFAAGTAVLGMLFLKPSASVVSRASEERPVSPGDGRPLLYFDRSVRPSIRRG